MEEQYEVHVSIIASHVLYKAVEMLGVPGAAVSDLEALISLIMFGETDIKPVNQELVDTAYAGYKELYAGHSAVDLV